MAIQRGIAIRGALRKLPGHLQRPIAASVLDRLPGPPPGPNACSGVCFCRRAVNEATGRLATLGGQVIRADGNCEIAKHVKVRPRDVGPGGLLGNIVRCSGG